mmetsp:Transcript_15299/g.36064  ORF Transcript_15299/g.36064 Transcript_15299/m.36064 type:complete len:252 (+) Transcript_15299:554-1309(+)
MEEAGGDTGSEGLAWAREDREACEQSLGACGVRRIREGVEEERRAAEPEHVRRFAQHLCNVYSFGVDAQLVRLALQVRACCLVPREQRERAVVDGSEDGDVGLEAAGFDLARVVEAREDRARSRNVRLDIRRERLGVGADERVVLVVVDLVRDLRRKQREPFGKKRRVIWRRHDGIADDVLREISADTSRKPQPCYLDGCGLQGDDIERVAFGVLLHVNQHVDRVLVDPLCHLDEGCFVQLGKVLALCADR